MSEYAAHLPIEALVGWIPKVDQEKDAVEYAKRQVEIHFATPEISWYAIAKFDNGYLFEIHHGGQGRGYLKSIVDNLRTDPDSEYWIPSGNRAVKIMMQEGEPLPLLLTDEESRQLVKSGHPPLALNTPMKPAVTKGESVLHFGIAVASVSFAFFLGALGFYGSAANPGPLVRSVDFAALPHAQWGLANNVTVEEIVSKLEMKGGKWAVEKRRNAIQGLDQLRSQGRMIDAQNRQRAAVEQQTQGEAAKPEDAAPSAALPTASPAPVVAVPQAETPKRGPVAAQPSKTEVPAAVPKEQPMPIPPALLKEMQKKAPKPPVLPPVKPEPAQIDKPVQRTVQMPAGLSAPTNSGAKK